MATSVIWPPRYYFLLLRAPFFGCLAKTTIQKSFSCKKKPSLIGPISFGPLVTVLMEFHCTFQIPPEPTKELSGVADLTYVAGIDI